MKKQLCGRLSLLLAILMMFSLFGGAAALADEEVFPDDSIIYVMDEELGVGEEVEGDRTVIEEGECTEGEPLEEGPETSSGHMDGEEEEVLGDNQEETFPVGYESAPLAADTSYGGSEDDIFAAATPTLSFTPTSVFVKKGDTTTVTIKASGYSGSVLLAYGTNNTSAYTCTWGSWSGSSIPMRIKGTALGSGTVTVYMISTSTHMVLTSKSFAVKVTSPDSPKLKLSSTSVSMEVGQSKKITVTGSGYSSAFYFQYSIKNSSVAKCAWGTMSSGKCPLTITGKAAGKTTVTVTMRASSSGSKLATATITVEVVKKPNPVVKLSVSSLSVEAGKSATVKATVSGISGGYYLSYSSSYTNYFKGTWASKWSGSSINLTITGLNAVTKGTATIYLKDSSGKTLNSAKLTVTVTPKPVQPSVTASPTSLSLAAGRSGKVTFTLKNCKDAYYLQYSTTNSSAYSLSWGSLSGSSIPLTVTGKAQGSGKVTLYVKRKSNDTIMAQASVSISVTGLSIYDIGYGFGNYGDTVSLDTCKLMYGNTQHAKNIYNRKIGNGGVCFGMASSSGLIDVSTSAPYVSTFNSSKSRISTLAKSDRSSSLNLTVKQFVEAMHITQSSTQCQSRMVWGDLNKLVSTAKTEIDAGRPLMICMWGVYNGSNAGHAVLAYNYKQESSTKFLLDIYDSNYATSSTNIRSTTLTITRSSSGGSYNNWSYNLWGSTYWGTGKPNSYICYVTYGSYSYLWNNRGKLTLNGSNLFSTTETSFSLYDFEGNLVLQYSNAEVAHKDDAIETIEIIHDPIDDDGERVVMFYAPVDLYTVVDDSADTPMEMMISDNELSIRIETDADMFDLCADDASNVVNAIMTPQDGAEYAITLGSSREADPDEVIVEGLGTGETISIGLDNGELSIVGADSAALYISNYDESFTIDAQAGEGGSISPEGASTVTAGSNLLYTIEPDDGFAVKSVYVDNADVGPVQAYHFDNVLNSHSIYAEFTRDLDTCDISLSQSVYAYDGNEHTPSVTVKAPGNVPLTEGIDYEVSYENNVEVGYATVYIIALPDGNYNGMQAAGFEITGQASGILDAQIDGSGHALTVAASHTSPAYVVVAVYDGDGRMTAVRIQMADTGTDQVVFAVDEINLNAMAEVRVMLLDMNLKPLAPSRLAQ